MHCLAGLWFAAGAVAGAAGVDFAQVRELAVKRAAEPYRAPDEKLPPRLEALSYDDGRKIHFNPEHALWRGDKLPFQLQFFPRGGLFRAEVPLHETVRGTARRLAYEPAQFRVTGIADLPALPADLGYAGFRVLHPLNRRGVFDEVAAFLGASYFRAVAAGQEYGLSARGLALDSGVEGRTEEFPRFAEFWIARPDAKAKTLTLHALLDSPSVAGAYEFVITPGEATRMDVKAALVFRENDKLPGYAPLTSMFWYGENSPRPHGEMRPEVHDSDGLLARERGGAQTWVPLRNPRKPEAIDVPLRDPALFGLAQRDRQLASYEDRVVRYEKRPSAWIEPAGNWPAGHVRLVQLPATKEYADNIVAYWVPERRPERGVPVELNYRLWWGVEPETKALARIVGTREGARGGGAKGARLWIDFAAPKGTRVAAEKVTVDAEVTGGGKLEYSEIAAYPEIGGWRATVEVDAAAAGQPVDVVCRLRSGGKIISETWRYRWEPL